MSANWVLRGEEIYYFSNGERDGDIGLKNDLKVLEQFKFLLQIVGKLDLKNECRVRGKTK